MASKRKLRQRRNARRQTDAGGLVPAPSRRRSDVGAKTMAVRPAKPRKLVAAGAVVKSPARSPAVRASARDVVSHPPASAPRLDKTARPVGALPAVGPRLLPGARSRQLALAEMRVSARMQAAPTVAGKIIRGVKPVAARLARVSFRKEYLAPLHGPTRSEPPRMVRPERLKTCKARPSTTRPKGGSGSRRFVPWC